MTRRRPTPDVLRTVVDDATAERLRAAARARGMAVEQLIPALLTAASVRVDELLTGQAPPAGAVGDEER